MPQVKDKMLKDEWYVNVAKGPDGKSRPLSLGTISFKPDQERFVSARARAESRYTHQEFEKALANGNLKIKGAVVKVVPPAPEVVTPPPPAETSTPTTGGRSRTDLQAMPKDTLITLAKELGLDDTGTKTQLIDRIVVAGV
jgi:hypothetical protein